MNDNITNQSPADPGPAPDVNSANSDTIKKEPIATEPPPVTSPQAGQSAAPEAAPASGSGPGGTLHPPAEPGAILEAAKSEKRETLSRALEAAQEATEKTANTPETPPKPGRPGTITPEMFEAIIASIESGLTVCAATKKHRVSRAAFYRFVGADKEFQDSLGQALACGPYAQLEEIAWQRATKGHVGKHKPSDSLLCLLLRGCHPRYRDAGTSIANSVTVEQPEDLAGKKLLLEGIERANQTSIEINVEFERRIQRLQAAVAEKRKMN